MRCGPASPLAVRPAPPAQAPDTLTNPRREGAVTRNDDSTRGSPMHQGSLLKGTEGPS